MKISVITLSWDNLDYTKAFVKSIRKNTSFPNELIIVDNGSESNTRRWVEKNADQFLIFDENQGFSKGFNEGVKIGVSSRGLGSVREQMGESIVEDDFQLICFDIVSEPSTPNAYIFPSKQKSRFSMAVSEVKENSIDGLFKKILRD